MTEFDRITMPLEWFRMYGVFMLPVLWGDALEALPICAGGRGLFYASLSLAAIYIKVILNLELRFFKYFRSETKNSVSTVKGIYLEEQWLHGAILWRILSPYNFRINRSIQVEGAFCVLKQDYNFRCFLTRGKENATTEFFFFALLTTSTNTTISKETRERTLSFQKDIAA